MPYKAQKDTNGNYVIDGEFFLIVNSNLRKTDCGGLALGHNNPYLDWPPQSVFQTYEAAEKVAKMLAERTVKAKGYCSPFFIVKAVGKLVYDELLDEWSFEQV